MKTKVSVTIGVLLGLTAFSNAFTLDFTGNVGAVLPGPLIIPVPGYGSVQFDAQAGTLTVDNSQTEAGVPVSSLVFDRGDTLRVTFLGLAPTDLSSSAVGLSAGENFIFLDSSDPKVYFWQLDGVAGGSAGLKTLTWNQVPEPSSAILGFLGGAMLVLRRRR